MKVANESIQSFIYNLANIPVDVGAGNLAVQSWFACYLGCSMVWALLDCAVRSWVK